MWNYFMFFWQTDGRRLTRTAHQRDPKKHYFVLSGPYYVEFFHCFCQLIMSLPESSLRSSAAALRASGAEESRSGVFGVPSRIWSGRGGAQPGWKFAAGAPRVCCRSSSDSPRSGAPTGPLLGARARSPELRLLLVGGLGLGVRWLASLTPPPRQKRGPPQISLYNPLPRTPSPAVSVASEGQGRVESRSRNPRPDVREEDGFALGPLTVTSADVGVPSLRPELTPFPAFPTQGKG